jgi:hypothetical protein
VGFFEGAAVGFLEGLLVGELVVGLEVGFLDGLDVGGLVGFFVGASVGAGVPVTPHDPNVVVSAPPNCPPAFSCTPLYMTLYDPLPYPQQTPSPYESCIVNSYCASGTHTFSLYMVF